MTRHWFRLFLIVSAAAAVLSAQAPTILYVPPAPTPAQTPPQTPAQTPATTTTPPANGVPIPGRLSESDPFSMDNVSLTEMIQVLAKRLKINYILDPRIK